MNNINNFFAMPTDEWGDNAVKLTSAGIFTVIGVIVLLIIISLIVRRIQSTRQSASTEPTGSQKKTTRVTTRQLVFSSAAVALALITSMIKLLDLPMGGSITLFSMLFITLIGYWYGPYVGIMTGMAYGLLQFILEPIFYTIPQLLVDYPLAFGALGVAGFFYRKKHGLMIGYLAGVLGRYVFSFLSGVIFFASYAPEGMEPVIYSLAYNGSYLLTEAAITVVILALPPVRKAFQQIKQLTAQN